MTTQRRLPTWREMHLDASPETEEFLFAFWRQAPAWRKWQSMVSLNQMVREMATAGLRNRYPNVSEAEMRRLLADIILGPETAADVYGPLPDKEQLK